MDRKIRLLIIDDEVSFIESIAKRLEMRGFDVTKACDGTSALEAVESKNFDIALLDLKMPGMDGLQVLKLLKEKHDYIEVIILTGHGSMESAGEAKKLGAFSFFTKPFDFDTLLTTIKDAYLSRVQKKLSKTDDEFEKMLLETIVPDIAKEPLELIEAGRFLENDSQ